MKKILFIGNSHTYFNDMPRMVQELFLLSGEAAEVTMLTLGGMRLDWHLKNEQTAFNLRYGNYDYCVLQQSAHPFDGYQLLSDGVSGIRSLVPGTSTKFALYMTWAEKKFPENQEEMSEAYEKTATEQHLLLAPVGRLWQKFRTLHPEIELYFTDGAHASPEGSFLAAATIFHTLHGKMGKTDGALPENSILRTMNGENLRKIWQLAAKEL